MGTQSRASRRNDPRLRAQKNATDARTAARRRARGASDVDESVRAVAGRRASRDVPTDFSSKVPARRGRSEAAAAAEASRARHRRRARLAAVSAVVAVVLVIGVVVGGFSWLRWFSGDDASDIQGTWYLAGTATPIEITEDRINLTDDVSYRYSLDAADKTIAFTFTNLAGSGCYRFSLDRQELALFDGSFTGLDTLGRDIGWTIEALVKKLQGDRLAPAEAGAEGLTLLSRKPAAGASSAKGDASEDAAASKDKKSKAKKTETIEDEPVGDLSGKLPADINDPKDKVADEDGSQGAVGGTSAEGAVSDAGDSGDSQKTARAEGSSGDAGVEGAADASTRR